MGPYSRRGDGMRVYAGIDLAAKGKHEVFVLDQNGEVVLSRYRFATQADEIDRLREKVRALRPEGPTIKSDNVTTFFYGPPAMLTK